MTLLKSKFWLVLFLILACAHAKAAEENIFPVAEIEDGWIKVRRGEDPHAAVIGSLHKGESFAAQRIGKRFRILDGPLAGGYIGNLYVKMTTVKAPLIQSMTDELFIRAEPKSDGRIIASVNRGAYFAGERQGDWYVVKSGPFEGRFVSAEFAKPIDEVGSSARGAQPMLVKPPPGAQANAAPSAPSSTVKGFLIKAKPEEFKTGNDENSAVTIPPAMTETSEGVATKSPTPPPTPPPTPSPIPHPSPPAPEPPKPLDASAEQRFEQEVEKAFKKKKIKNETNEISIPVFRDNSPSPSGQVNAQVGNGKAITVDGNEFFKILHKYLADSWFEKAEVKALIPKSGQVGVQWLAVAQFANTGVSIVYDELKLEIRIMVPPELRSVEALSLVSEGEAGQIAFERQSSVSSYLNINATETVDSRLQTYNDRRSPLQAQLESGTNIKSFVLEAFGTYTEKRDSSSDGHNAFIRQDVRVTRDFPGALTRASVGDITYPVESFQVYRQMKGAAYFRQYAMAPSKLTYPTGNREIFLKNNSRVSIWVNDQLQKVIDLPAGRHQLQDFQYTSGMNDVRFEIVDEYGQSEIINFSYTASTDLLRPGFQQFSYAAGTPSGANPISGERTYDSTNDTFSAFHRYGFSEYFTGGVNGQLDSKQSLFGLEGNFSLAKGYLKLESAYSHTAQVGSGFALGSQYNFMDYKGPDKTQRSLNVGLVLRSDMFSDFGTITSPTVARLLDLTIGYTRGITKMMSMNTGANYTLNKKITTDAGNSYQLRVGVSNRWTNGISANVTATHSRLSSGKDDIGVTAFLIWSFPKDRQTLSAYTNSTDISSRVGWNYNPSSGADSANYQANIHDDKLEKGYVGSVAYNGNHARLAASHEVLLTKIDDPATSTKENEQANNVTTLQMGTALVYAGGQFGIGRPVTDSFAIVAPRKSLKNETLMINPDSEENYISKSDWLGPAVIPELSSYTPTVLIVGAKNLPLGVSIPQDHFNLYPRYKSGYGFPVGNDANIYLVVTLTDAAGTAIGMSSGVATNLDDPSEPPITVFTSRKGILQSEGFKAGHYRVEIATDKFEPFDLVVPKDAKEEYNLGRIALKERKAN